MTNDDLTKPLPMITIHIENQVAQQRTTQALHKKEPDFFDEYEFPPDDDDDYSSYNDCPMM